MPETAQEEQAQDFMDMDKAAAEIGWNKATVYGWLKRLNIETHKFKGSRKAFLTPEEVARVKEVKAKPWLAGEKTK